MYLKHTHMKGDSFCPINGFRVSTLPKPSRAHWRLRGCRRYQVSAVSFRWNASSIFLTSTTRALSSACASGARYPRSVDKRRRYSTSEADPAAIDRNRARSLSPERPHPSAMFVGIDVADLRSCVVTPKSS